MPTTVAAVSATVALYERLFSSEVPSEATGDPPHEPQGWYGVYHTDTSTLDGLKRSAVDLCPLPPYNY